MNPTTTLIFSGNYQQFSNYMRAKKLNPATTAYLDHATQLNELHEPRVIRIGTWYTRADKPAIERAIANRRAVVTDDPFEGMQ